jgi:opacity protein-like surface antigen
MRNSTLYRCRSIAPWALPAAACLAFATSLRAAEPRDGFLLGGGLVAGYTQADGLEKSGPVPGKVNSSDINDTVAGLSLAAGYARGPLRAEIEYVWRYRFDIDVNLGDRANLPRYKSDVRTQTLMLNLYWDFYNRSRFTPYLGAGAGYVHNEADSEERLHGSGVHDSSSEDGDTWALMAGVGFDLSKRWQMDVGYRYQDLGRIEIGPFPDGVSLKSSDYTTHDLRLSLHYRF